MIRLFGNGGRLVVSTIFLLLAISSQAHAWNSVNLGSTGAVRTLYMQVGVGAGVYPAASNNTTVNNVSVTVPASAVGNSVAQVMGGTGATNSYYDGAAICPAGSVYIAGYYRRDTSGTTVDPATAPVTVTTPVFLDNGMGDTIPFSQISWTSSGGSKAGGSNFPSGSFSSTSVSVGSVPRNRWQESCFVFSYANTVDAAAGTYSGRATYTVSIP